ncbi:MULTISPECIES: DNA-methyltransferase [unclassified Vibrio]|uniref:DNA-methyltransferase n=1 Tax=unclassified Vibrio TaxID=2614977 RepID=UPI001361201B|nr:MULTISPECIES: site-specific DNA-methyltransferase [unclassified Vibrio]NAW59650.1 site-specific DNA-methyltransferase [Vibrio sp. V36_P2S2PM302]NAX23715.1 site-specific DNA-methyltransferase [Vibrio sp. V39_P1S14PM300]NAX25010.1 site-specific DNA-methyltransferase [Vibrio sp. V38_P2S17PM301]NAX28596.1 site-specific DNA-methyltransferase [Vibrio sp. V37_P2S8PM304]
MQQHTLCDGRATLIHADCLAYLKNLSDNTVDLILTDPPYFQVKKNAWDNQWPDVDTFLAWLDEVLMEFWRVLKPSGSLYLFCGSKLASDTEILLRQRFDVLNHIIWAKPSGPWKRMHKPDLRMFFPATERILFAGHYKAEGYAKGCSGYASQCQQLKKQVFRPLMDYFINARKRLGVTAKEINAATDSQMCSHWFGESQWKLPNQKQYQQLQALFAQKQGKLSRTHSDLTKEYDGLQSEYQALVREYDDLKAQYQHLRRPFAVTSEVPYTDVWHFPPVQYYPGKHPCEKPQSLLEHIVTASSRENDVVLDAFMGSGATGKASLNLNRRFIGVEMEEETFEQTRSSIENLMVRP